MNYAEQHNKAVAEYQSKFDADLFEAASAGHISDYQQVLRNAALVLCGSPWNEIVLGRNFSEADQKFLNLFR